MPICLEIRWRKQFGAKVLEDIRKGRYLSSDTFLVYGFTGDTPSFQHFGFFLCGAFVQNEMGNHGIVAGERAKGFFDGSFFSGLYVQRLISHLGLVLLPNNLNFMIKFSL